MPHRIAFAVAMLAVLMAASAAAAQVLQAARYIEGIVSGIDPRTRTLTMGNATYYIRHATTSDLNRIYAGDEVEVTYVIERGQRVALDVKKLRRGGLLLFRWQFRA